MSTRSILIMALVLTAVLSPPAPAEAKDIVINAANFDESYNAGFTAPSGTPGYLVGLDYPGDWVQYHFTAPENGTFSTSISLMGTSGVNFHLELLLTSEGIVSEQLFDFYFTGAGFG